MADNIVRLTVIVFSPQNMAITRGRVCDSTQRGACPTRHITVNGRQVPRMFYISSAI